ncbi:MAG: tetratricopeptide repeat protein [Bacteroidia bacterium]|nr:MAG: tetratricopeptide repeat protein [Bacteroidia bacterium]
MSIQETIMRYLLKPNRVAMHKHLLQCLLLIIPVLGFGQSDPYLSGRACMISGSLDSAATFLEEALLAKPGDAELYYHLGEVHFGLHNYPAARDAFYECEKRRKGMGSFYLAKIEVKLNHEQQALKYLRIHLSSRYKLSESDILLDEDLSTLENLPAWQQLWNEKTWYSSPDMEYQQAIYLKNQGDFLEAINLLNKLEEQGYKRSQIQAEKAIIYQELGNMKAASSSLKSAVKSDARNLDALQQLARIQTSEGDAEEAVAGLDRVIRQDPARFEAYILRAEARSQNGDLTGAIEDMDLYLAYFPVDDSAIYLKGMIQFAHGKYLDAIQSFNKSLALDSGKSEYYYGRGRTYAATGTTRYAERDMSMALDLDPLNGEIWFEKGKLAEQLGDRIDACHCFRKAYQYGIFEAGELVSTRCN